MVLQGDVLPNEYDMKHLKQKQKLKCDQIMKSKSKTIERTLSFALLCAVNYAKEPGASN